MLIRMHLAVAYLVALLFSGYGYAQAVPAGSIPPNCRCSPGTAASIGSGNGKSEVYIANCRCDPQNCAVSWNTSSKYAGVSLACSVGEVASEQQNCVDFSKYPRQEFKDSKSFGAFEVKLPASVDYRSGQIGFTDLADENGGDVLMSPDSLHFIPAATIRLPAVATRIEITYVAGQKSGIHAQWLNEKMVLKKIHFGVADPERKILTASITDPDGIGSITFFSQEHSYLKLCVFKNAESQGKSAKK